MAKEIEMEPLYERDYNLPQDTYVCSATGLVCEKVSQHFREYRAFIEHLSETNDNRLFLQILFLVIGFNQQNTRYRLMCL